MNEELALRAVLALEICMAAKIISNWQKEAIRGETDHRDQLDAVRPR